MKSQSANIDCLSNNQSQSISMSEGHIAHLNNLIIDQRNNLQSLLQSNFNKLICKKKIVEQKYAEPFFFSGINAVARLIEYVSWFKSFWHKSGQCLIYYFKLS